MTTVSRRTSLLVVGMGGWPLLPDGTISRKLRRAESLQRAGSPIRTISEAEFLEVAGLSERRPALRKSFPAQQACDLVGIKPETLTRWEALGLVRAQDGRYDFQDLVSLQTVAELVRAGVSPQTISRSILGLAAVLPGTERPLAQLRIVTEGPRSLLAELGELRLAPDGQLMLNFTPASGPPPEPALPFAERGCPETATAWFERALGLEEDERLDAAERAYREALARQPVFPEAHFNLANVLRGQGRLEAAEERYRIALAQDPALAAAWYNLADLLEETERIGDAISCLKRALQAEPAYADAHFNLAYCYEQAGRGDEAAAHWRAYLQIDPASEWARIARAHLAP